MKILSEYICEGIDRLITLDLGGRGIIYKLYEAARELTGEPLTLSVAKQIKNIMEGGRVVIFMTGFRVPPSNLQETDGPSGTVALANAMNLAFGIKPLFIIEDVSKNILDATIRSVGMDIVPVDKLLKVENKRASAIIDFPMELKAASEKAEAVLDEYKPLAVIAIEKAGMNKKGVYHTMRGYDVSIFHSKVEPLIDKAKSRGILTIGIGDGGNEVGMGKIRKSVEKFVPYALECQCPCKGGIAAVSEVDVLVVAAVSNWGAYGVEACIAYLAEKPEIFHDSKIERLMIESMVKAGAIDGVTGRNEASVDNIPSSLHECVVSMLGGFIRK